MGKMLLNNHIKYHSPSDIRSNQAAILKQKALGHEITNGLGIEGRVYVTVNGKDILVPAPLHPMILSAVKGKTRQENPYVVDSNGKQNGPFLGPGCANWLQQISALSAKILSEVKEDDESKHKGYDKLYRKLDKLLEEDGQHHGRVGEFLYVLLDMAKAQKDPINYKSPTFREYKQFISDIDRYCKNGDVNIGINNEFFNGLSVVNKRAISRVLEGSAIVGKPNLTVRKYIQDQFPKMIREGGNVAYYNLSKR